MKLRHLILMKIIKLVVTRCQILWLKCYIIDLGLQLPMQTFSWKGGLGLLLNEGESCS